MNEFKIVEAAENLDGETLKDTLLNVMDKGVSLTNNSLNEQSQEVIDLTRWKKLVIEEIREAISDSISRSNTPSIPAIDYERIATIITQKIEKIQIPEQSLPSPGVDYERITLILKEQIREAFKTNELPTASSEKEIEQIVIKRLSRISFPNPFPKDFALIISLLTGLTSGIGIFGAIANFYLVPHAIETNRLVDNQQLKFLNTTEGQFYLKLIKANSGYIDSGKCQTEAQAQKLKLTRTVGTTKTEITNVCLLKMP
jgi:hypothetical protein